MMQHLTSSKAFPTFQQSMWLWHSHAQKLNYYALTMRSRIHNWRCVSLTFHFRIISDYVGTQTLLSKDFGEEPMTCELLPVTRLSLMGLVVANTKSPCGQVSSENLLALYWCFCIPIMLILMLTQSMHSEHQTRLRRIWVTFMHRLYTKQLQSLYIIYTAVSSLLLRVRSCTNHD